jgi:hypothetical protein
LAVIENSPCNLQIAAVWQRREIRPTIPRPRSIDWLRKIRGILERRY